MAEGSLAQSAAMMRIVGWLTLLVLPLGFLVFPSGFLWGTHHESAYEPWSPYLFMLVAMYLAWAILMIRGARDPITHRAIVDYGILANLLHGIVMLVQAFVYSHELQHLWGDVPALFVICAVLWHWHPMRAPR